MVLEIKCWMANHFKRIQEFSGIFGVGCNEMLDEIGTFKRV